MRRRREKDNAPTESGQAPDAGERREEWPEGIPHPGWFLTKSAEAIEKKRVEFLMSAKECARV